jgi:acyl-CoA thioesterase-1
MSSSRADSSGPRQHDARRLAGVTLLLLALLAGGSIPASATPDHRGSATAYTAPTVPAQRMVERLSPWSSLSAAPRKLSAGNPPLKAPTTSTQLPTGSIARNPATGRREVVVRDIAHTAVLIGDSQSAGADTWPQLALSSLGYSVSFAGAGGTGFVAANNDGTPNYYDSLITGEWVLPHGDPALIVLEGGGNDAGRGATDEQILANANGLILALKQTYPTSRLVLIGTLSRSAQDGGGRRAEVDTLLGDLAEMRGIPFVSTGDWLTTHRLEEFLADTVHLKPAGHQRAAELLRADLADLKLGVEDTTVDPATRWTGYSRPLE